MGLFGMFGGNKGATAVQEGEMVPGMVNMLAGMPGMMRKQMMKGRINQLLTLPEARRRESIIGMFSGFHHPKVNEKNRSKVIATRVEIVGELAEDKRRTIITSRIAALKDRPELDEADLRGACWTRWGTRRGGLFSPRGTWQTRARRTSCTRGLRGRNTASGSGSRRAEPAGPGPLLRPPIPRRGLAREVVQR